MDSKYVPGTPEIARFDFTRGDLTTDKTSKRINLCAEYLWLHGYGDKGTQEAPILWSDLTKNKKLKLVADHLEDVINNAAKTQLSTQMQDAARAQADLDAEADY